MSKRSRALIKRTQRERQASFDMKKRVAEEKAAKSAVEPEPVVVEPEPVVVEPEPVVVEPKPEPKPKPNKPRKPKVMPVSE